MEHFDVVIIGAGAAGMFAAIEAGRRGRAVLLVDHNTAPGEKIRISGGGRCNFTNLHIAPAAFLSENPKFALSALKRYTQWDFIARIERAGIAWHEKALGQLFCDGSAREIVTMLIADMADAGVTLRLASEVGDIRRVSDRFRCEIAGSWVDASALVIATGGKSIPKMGATGFAYRVAREFGLAVTETRPGLVPLTFATDDLAAVTPLAGLSTDAEVCAGGTRFREGLLITHRGLSGPSILQASSYWRDGAAISIDLSPDKDINDVLSEARRANGRQATAQVLAQAMPKRLAVLRAGNLAERNVADLSDADMRLLGANVHQWQLHPNGSEGYRTAEVTLGGVSTGELDSRDMAARKVPGLYFIGEAVDVTGWLGGYNFQWAWSSGWAAGQVA